MSKKILQTKSFAFALDIISAYKKLMLVQKEYVLSKQLLRSGTAVGALVREAEYAQSKADFISKLSIGLKEANETEYWLLLLKESKYLSEIVTKELIHKNKELISILIASIKTAKKSINKL